MKKLLLLVIFTISISHILAQNTAITIGGDFDKFYPVVFHDNAWYQNKETVLEIGRSDVHTNSSWRGSLIAKFSYHLTQWGHGSHFIDADIKSHAASFIAGWVDGSQAGGGVFIVWLRGGNTTYYLNSNAALSYEVHDGLQGSLPYQETNGPLHNYKIEVEAYANNYGQSVSHPVYWNYGGTNYINGNLGIGTKTPVAGERLAVNGLIRAKEIKVENANWPDYVFEDEYKLKELERLKEFIQVNKHLPDIPSAEEVDKHGVNLGEMNAKLLQKVEELTLYLIRQNEQLEEQQNEIRELKVLTSRLKNHVK